MRASAIVVVVCLVGCGSGSSADSYGTSVERRIAEARCVATSGPACFSSSGPGVSAPGFCADLGVIAFRERAAAVDRGTVTVNEAELERCLTGVPCLASSVGAPAVAPRDPLAACRTAFVGTVPSGGACFVDEECAPSGFCAGAIGSSCGICTGVRELGSRCQRDAECPLASLCVNGTCVTTTQDADSDVGGPCGLYQQTLMESARYASCRPGLYCVGLGMERRCIEPLPVGSSCTVGMGECTSGAVCLSGTCVAQTVVGEVGGSCDSQRLCAPERLVCVGGRCVVRPREGESCETAPCDIELECVGGFCRRNLADGSTCSRDSACASGFCLDSICTREPVCAS